jgi:hypothetical protein
MAGTFRKSAPRSRARFIVRPLFAALVASGIVAPAYGATIVVSDGGDAGTGTTCTLRQAIASLNGGAAIDGCSNTGGSFGTADNVDLTGRTGTITLAGATALPVAVDMQIVGPGPALLTISGANASRVFEISNLVSDFELGGVTVANGKSAGPGGCIYAVPPSSIFLSHAVVTGCTANDDPNFGPTPYNGVGGGVFAYAVQTEYTTISANTARTAGGGVAGGFVLMNQTLVTGNTVLGETVSNVSTPGDKYSALALFATFAGGGGILSTGPTNLSYSVVSSNTVHASHFIGIGPTQSYEYRFGTGGGITAVSLGKYTNPEMISPTGKSTIAGAGPLPPRPTHAKAAQLRAKAASRWTAPAAKVALLQTKADGESGGLGLRNSTISGNRVLGGGGVPNNTEVLAKYAGGGAAFYSTDYNAEFANSTVSGNVLPGGGICSEPSGPSIGNLYVVTCGAGLVGDSAELSNSTVTGNSGATAVQFKYGTGIPFPTATASAKSAVLLDAHPRLKQALLQGQAWRAKAGATSKASTKAFSAAEFVSTIVAANIGVYDVGCYTGCSIGGSANLVGTAQATVTLPGGTLGGNPQLAPLANRGGVPAGAPGILGTGPTQTHALYVGSPALNVGANIEGFSYDQRGPGFPRTVGAGTDIGAYEGSVPRPVNPVPALGPWMLGVLSALVGALGLWRRRRRA